MNETQPRLVIVGSGLVGPALALALCRIGANVSLFDRSAILPEAAEDQIKAINITLCRRGLRALAALGLEESVQRLGAPARGRTFHHPKGEASFNAYGRAGESLLSIRRHDLRNELLRELATCDQIQKIGKSECLDVDPDRAELLFRGPQGIFVVEYDYLIAADGINSPVRRGLERAGLLSTELTYPPIAYKDLVIPAEQAQTLRGEPQSLHFWPRGTRVVIGFPNHNRTMTLSLHEPVDASGRFGGHFSRDDLREMVVADFPDLFPLVEQRIDQLWNRPAGYVATAKVSDWNPRPNILLIGDAAHAMTPYYGQGANAGFEDCLVLERLIRDCGGSWAQAFRRFSGLRKPDLDLIADLSLKHLDFLQVSQPKGDPDLLYAVETVVREHLPQSESLYNRIAFSELSYTRARDESVEFESVVGAAMSLLRQMDARSSRQGVEIRAAVRSAVDQRETGASRAGGKGRGEGAAARMLSR